MRIRCFCNILILFVWLMSRVASGQVVEKLPNVLLITIDTLRADHLSAYGYHLKTSPNIDSLASEGARFAHAYSVVPLTGPSHFSLFVSRYPQEHGARINGVAVQPQSKWLSLPQALRQLGYFNAAFVSAWPLTSRLTGLHRWFDVYDEELTRSYQVFNSSRHAEDVTPRVISWLTNHRVQPFFLWVHYFDPHSPYLMRKEFSSLEPSGHKGSRFRWRASAIRERIQKYDSEIRYTDHHLGNLVDTLDRLGLRESTLVVLTADHGESLGEHGYVGHGRRLSEGILQVPLIMRHPKIPPGTVIAAQVSLLDVTPTILDLAETNKSVRLPASFAGQSLARAVQGKGDVARRPVRYVTFAGKKGWLPGWLSRLWLDARNMPLRLGKTEGVQKWVWTPEETRLSIFNTARDPLELDPKVLSDDNIQYEEATSELKEWFNATNRGEADRGVSEQDEKVLRSLGYTQ
ncbi:MAG: sulfatase [Acidobacteria bacterium]|nr:sulfatase [Acidobacteriota bacterium]MCI0626655.1 sulfatase [Acidobacteriota bacterium]MCI0717771.1 sulfatase [Acidobacteriota bacterium]